MTPTNFIILMISFGCFYAVISWLYDGYKIDQEKKQEELTKSFNRNNENR
jgi:cbb3-type cytochrome oxidase subunit 3